MTIVKDDMDQIYSCLFNVHEVETSPGNKEIWFSYDNKGQSQDGTSYPLSFARFNLLTGEYLGDIDTQTGAWYQWGGSSTVETNTQDRKSTRLNSSH